MIYPDQASLIMGTGTIGAEAGLHTVLSSGATQELSSPQRGTQGSTLDPQFYEVSIQGGMHVYICKYGECRRVVSGKSQFERHLRTHTGEKPFECKYCDYKSSRKGNLKTHTIKRHPEVVQTVLDQL